MAQFYIRGLHILKNQKLLLGTICVQKKILQRQFGLKVRQKNAEVIRIFALGCKLKQNLDAKKDCTRWISSTRQTMRGIISISIEQMTP